MAKEVVAWAAELVTAKAVVMLITAEADLEVELGHDAVVLQALPLAAGVDHPRVDCLLDNRTADICEYNSSDRSHRKQRAAVLCQVLHSKDETIRFTLNWEKPLY